MRRFDPENTWQAVQKRMLGESDPRRRQLLQQVRDHMRAEVRGELEPLMATLVDDPQYHFRGLGVDIGPKGREAVRSFYEQMIARGDNRFEFDVQRIAVDADSVVTEGEIRQVVRGSAVIAGGKSEVDGEPVDPDARYLTSNLILTVWPAAADGRLVGEDIWFGTPPNSDVTRYEDPSQ